MCEVIRNCEVCEMYFCQEILDTDYGGIYADYESCYRDYDIDESTGLLIEDFDRTCERECCELSFCKVSEVDKELIEILGEMEIDEDGEYLEYMEKAYKRFKEKYIEGVV